MFKLGNTSDIQYFIPEWDDLVSKYYDFWADKDLDKEKVYAHEIYPKPNYDGILVSRMKLEQSKLKINKIKEVGGVHNFFNFVGKPVFGDCGAWGYVKEDKPPFETNEILNYYHELKFDIGVSIDHLCVPEYASKNEQRKNLTLKNAEQFINRYTSKGYSFIPMGVCQGWDVESYKESVKEILDMGYTHIAIGGIARAQTSVVLNILKIINPLIKKNSEFIHIHLFGVARLEAIRLFRSLNVTSFDSASPLRSAWLGSKKNYRDQDWNGYSAIRLPYITREKKVYSSYIQNGYYSMEDLKDKEENIKILLKRYEIDKSRTPEEVTDAFMSLYEEIIPETPDRREEYLHTLRDRPWDKCDCTICQDVGMEVIIFRGNNRNRRRGFHNTYIFYKLLKKLLIDPNFSIKGEIKNDDEQKSYTLDRFLDNNKRSSKKEIKRLIDFV